MTHDLPPHEQYVTHSQQNSPAKRKHLHAYGNACAEAAIAPYKAEIERLTLDRDEWKQSAKGALTLSETNFNRAEKAEAEVERLRELIEELDRHEGAEGWSEGMRERIDAALGEKP